MQHFSNAENKDQPQIPNPVKASIKKKGQIKTSSSKGKQREFVNRPTLEAHG